MSARMRAALAQATPALRIAAAQVWQKPGLRPRYQRYLRVMHGVLRASVPLMERAAARSAPGSLRDYFRRHIEEEREHDEWLIEDLAVLGCPRSVVDEVPPPVVARLVGAQYYWIEHHHPVALLGYIAVLEGNAPDPGLCARLVTHAGLPPAALRTVREHAALDTGHTEEVYQLLEALSLTEAHSRAVSVSALSAAQGLMELFAYVARTPATTKDGAR
jgi:hypothetical protein